MQPIHARCCSGVEGGFVPLAARKTVDTLYSRDAATSSRLISSSAHGDAQRDRGSLPLGSGCYGATLRDYTSRGLRYRPTRPVSFMQQSHTSAGLPPRVAKSRRT